MEILTEYIQVAITLTPKHIKIKESNGLNLSAFVRNKLKELGQNYPHKGYKEVNKNEIN